jgi:hypothetical protein
MYGTLAALQEHAQADSDDFCARYKKRRPSEIVRMPARILTSTTHLLARVLLQESSIVHATMRRRHFSRSFATTSMNSRMCIRKDTRSDTDTSGP